MKHLGQRCFAFDFMLSSCALKWWQCKHGEVKAAMRSLLQIVRRVQYQPEEPTPQDLVRALGDPAVVLGIGKRAAQDQPQRTVDQLPLEVGEHVSCRVYIIALVIELLDRVR